MTAMLQRTFVLERGKSGDTIDLAISSETPYERWFGIEVLGHRENEVDLSRLGDGRHPLLINHNTDRQVGVIQSVKLDSDGVLRGTARFSKSPEALEILADVRDGIRTLVSVGYMVDEIVEMTDGKAGRTFTWDEFKAEQRELHGDDFYRAGASPQRAAGGKEPPVYRVTRWTPFEASLVAVPADVTVGVGRSAEAEVQPQSPNPPRMEITKVEDTNLQGAEAEKARVKGIVDIGEAYGKYVGQKDIADAIRNGRSVEQFKDTVMAKMESAHTDTSALHIGMTQKEVQRYSLGRALVASITGDWSQAGFEREASAAVAKVVGRAPEGFYLPFDVFRRDFNVGTSTEAGNLVPTDLRTDMYVDALRNALVMAGLGIRILPGLTGNIDLPRKSVAGTLGMLTEIGSASETNPNIQKVTLSPHRVGAYTEVSKQALIQAAMSLEGMIRDDLLMGAAVLLESQMISGTGTAASDAQIKGLRNVSGIGTTTAGSNGAALAWDHLVNLESACADANAEPDRLAGYLTNTKVRGKAKRTTKSTYLSWIWDGGAQPVNGYRCAVSNNIPSNLTKGTSTTICSAALFSSDWSMGVLGLFGAPDVTVDPYTKADTGQVKITLNQFADFGVRQPACFSKIEDILTT